MKYSELPVYQHKDLILGALENSQVIVVESPTGSGKTTQLPVILHSAGYAANGMIGVTQPRRIAVLSVSEYIARQLNETIPGIIGYKMRFADLTGEKTKIKIMTDGILLQEMKLDPWLSKYNCIIVDEAHERSLTIDFILGLLKRILEVRHSFKVIISSATINTGIFSAYFGDCPVVKIDAVTYPVTLVYDPPPVVTDRSTSQEIILNKISVITERVVNEKRQGDILIFLSGEKFIKDCMARLIFGPVGKKLHIIPLYGRLGKEEQERIFEKTPWGKTKVVIATNIAETSVTIDGITAVIDSGFSKLNFYNPRTFTSSLVEGPISKASCNQRKGRAGRTQSGSCYRLYSRLDFESRPLFTTEEIYRTDLSEVVLRMAELGITNFEDFDFISPPERVALISAVETLCLLGALETDNTLSKIGKMMTEFPLAPRQSRIIVEAILQYPQVTQETIIAAAFLSTQSPYILPPGEETDARRAHHNFRDPLGDFLSYIKLFDLYSNASDKEYFCKQYYLDEKAMAEIANVVEQLELIVSGMGVPILRGGSTEDYLCSLARGHIQFVCVRQGRDIYRSLTADRILIHPGSVMFKMDPEFIVAGEIIRTSRMYASSVSPLSKGTLDKIGGDLFNKLYSGGYGGKKTSDKKEKKQIRDWTNSIKIGGEVFEIVTIKNKKRVVLPWEQLSKVKDNTGELLYKGLKGVITIKNKYMLLENEKLNLILRLVKTMEIDGALTRERPCKKEFNVTTDLQKIVEAVKVLLLPVLCKPNKKEIGFICLTTNNCGIYRLKCVRGFHTALNENLSSLENLIDELTENVDLDKKNIINQTYRRLSDYLS
ncbi:ATP-dependent helicase HrpA [Spirochaetia bacterium]|nr:ATP-dependent helicase HrpA [Spirochaetia bacterium]GHV20460.1 ATP-dependent helicase HrpA [Spirochaetia bacterium]